MTQKEIIVELSRLGSLDPVKEFFFYNNLSENGFSDEEIEQIKVAVAFTNLFRNPEKYKAMKQCFIETYAYDMYNSFKNK